MSLLPSADSPPSRWLRLFAIDLRSLALFRIALGLLILTSLALRTVDFRIFYTDEGVWPVAVAWDEKWEAGMWSLHLLNGSFSWQAALWVAEAFAGLALLLGWRTRVAVVLAWVLVASVQKRNVMIVSGAGSLLRQLLFWGMWLPLGARWSLDARRRGTHLEGGAPATPGRCTSGLDPASQELRPPVPADAVLSMASAALLLQVVLVYFSNAIYKSDPAWRSTGDAIWLVLNQESYTRPLGRALREWPGLLRVVTHFTMALESFGPLLAFIPWANARWRLLAAALFISFHAGLAATLYVGLFPFVSMTAWIPFLPGILWSRETGRELFRRYSWPINIAAAVCFVGVLGWNLRPLCPWLSPVLEPFCHALRLEQRWAMFAHPIQTDTWYVVVGTDACGVETNLWTGESPVKWRRPRDFAEYFPNDSWKLYFLNLRLGGGQRARLFAEWLVRRWHSAHPGAPPFTKVEVYCLEESTRDRRAVPDNYLIYSDPPAENEAEPLPEPPLL